MGKKMRVLFLCSGNSARSQMAEAILRKFAGDRFEVFSAGIEPKGIHPLTLEVMQEAGYDLSAHTSKPLSDYIGKKNFDYLITVCSDADKQCPHFPGMGTRMHWGFEDPAAFEGSQQEKTAKFRDIRDQITDRIRSWLGELGVNPK
jgi:arsenate reductase